MLTCSLGGHRQPAPSPLSLLCLGAHSDDLEIGAGGSVMKLLEEHPGSTVTWIVFSGKGTPREEEARCGAARFTRLAARSRIEVLGFQDGFFPYDGRAVKEYFEALKREFPAPDLILTHYRDDRHQDHRTISDLTWNTFRDHLIWEYEIPKYDGDFGAPNLFVTLTDKQVQEKCAGVLETFHSQNKKHWLTEDLLRSVLRIRGMEAGGAQTPFAEAFYTRKMTL